MAAKLDAWQQRSVVVDAVDGVQHRLGTLYPLLAFDRAADLHPTLVASFVVRTKLLDV